MPMALSWASTARCIFLMIRSIMKNFISLREISGSLVFRRVTQESARWSVGTSGSQRVLVWPPFQERRFSSIRRLLVGFPTSLVSWRKDNERLGIDSAVACGGQRGFCRGGESRGKRGKDQVLGQIVCGWSFRRDDCARERRPGRSCDCEMRSGKNRRDTSKLAISPRSAH